MERIVLIRHAQASFGSDDYDRLSPLGHQQADWLAHYFRDHDLRFDQVWRGALRRHRETAQAVLHHDLGPEPRVDARFNELDYDALQGDYSRDTGVQPAESRAEFLRIFPEVIAGWAAGRLGQNHESFADFESRVLAALDAAAIGGTVLIVTSGGVIGMILRRVLNLDIAATADMMLNIRNASIHELAREGGRLRLSLFNACPHFDPTERSHARTYI